MAYFIIQIGSGTRGNESVCVSVSIFLIAYISESGTVIPIILFHSPWFSKRGLNDTYVCLSVYL